MNTSTKIELIGYVTAAVLLLAIVIWGGYCAIIGTSILEAKCKQTNGWIERDYAKHRFVRTPSGRAIYMDIYGKERAPGDFVFFLVGID